MCVKTALSLRWERAQRLVKAGAFNCYSNRTLKSGNRRFYLTADGSAEEPYKVMVEFDGKILVAASCTGPDYVKMKAIADALTEAGEPFHKGVPVLNGPKRRKPIVGCKHVLGAAEYVRITYLS